MRPWLLWLATCVALHAGEQRIASYSPGATQTLIDLGCLQQIVMGTRWCPLPKDHAAARDADVFQPDLERLLRVKPDLVILPRMANPLWAEKCAQAGLRTLILHPESAHSVSADIRQLGAATGLSEAAQKISDQLTARSAQKRATIVVVWDGVMAGPESYLAEPLAAAGFTSALAQGAWVKMDWELLASTRPAAILWIQNSSAAGPIELSPDKILEMARIPHVRDLPCVKNGRIYRAKSGSNWLPGSGLVKIYPELLRLRSDLGK